MSIIYESGQAIATYQKKTYNGSLKLHFLILGNAYTHRYCNYENYKIFVRKCDRKSRDGQIIYDHLSL